MYKENKQKFMIIAVILIVVLLMGIIIFNAAILKSKNETNIISSEEVLKTDQYEIKIKDYFEANYLMVEDLNHKFDKYLSVSLEIKNISEKEINFIAFDHFFMDDGKEHKRHFIIDENKKSFNKKLKPDDTFNITLTFPVYNKESYTLYFNETIKKKSVNKLGFTIDSTKLEKKDVKQTVEHDLYNELKGRINKLIKKDQEN